MTMIKSATAFGFRRLAILPMFACILAPAFSSVGQAADDPKLIQTDFDTNIKPFFNQHCARCHNPEKKKGKVTLHDLEPTAVLDDLKRWNEIIEVLEFAEMPPEDEPQPDKAEIKKITDWIKARLAETGHDSDVDYKLLQPGYANLIHHEKLFDGSQKGPAHSRPRLWRLHPEAYDNILKQYGHELNKGGPLSRPFVVGEGKGEASNYADLLKADVATLSQLMMNCKQIAALQTTGFTVLEHDRKAKKAVERHYRRAPKSFDALIEAEGDLTDDLLRAAVTEQFNIVLLRDPSESEMTDFVDLLKEAIDIGGRTKGLRTMASAVLMRPEAIYRLEVGLGETDDYGRRMLSPYELAHAIAYALTDLPPDKLMLGTPDRHRRAGEPSLMDLARGGKLQTRDDVRWVVTRIWENESVSKPRILRFFQEFFGYHKAGAVFKGERAGREFSTQHLVRSADQLVLHIVNEDYDVLKRLLTTQEYFFEPKQSKAEYDRAIKGITEKVRKNKPTELNYRYFVTWAQETGKNPIPQANPAWRGTAKFFNLDPDDWDYPIEQPFRIRDRYGILTHPAWLAAWSTNFDNDPIRRGKWIREHLLAGSIPDVPITVDASVPHDPTKTLRERLEKTREEYCWNCHRKMDPLGLPFEAYTDFGRHRREEGLGATRALEEPENTARVDTSGEIIDSGDRAIDGKVRDVNDLMQKLAGSDRVRQSFIRHAFRYWMGRNETLLDSPTLMKADRAYIVSGGSFKAMSIEILTSDSFLYRR